MIGKPWTEEEKAEVRQRIEAGESYRSIGRAIGRHDNSVRTLCLRDGLRSEHKVPSSRSRPEPKPIPGFDKEHAQWLREVRAAQERRQRHYEGVV